MKSRLMVFNIKQIPKRFDNQTVTLTYHVKCGREGGGGGVISNIVEGNIMHTPLTLQNTAQYAEAIKTSVNKVNVSVFNGVFVTQNCKGHTDDSPVAWTYLSNKRYLVKSRLTRSNYLRSETQ